MTTSINAPVTKEPAPKTQMEIIRAHLITGATITTWDAYRLYQITSLAQRIHNLRSAGLVIQSEMIKHNNKWFAVYWINEESLLESNLSNSEVN